MEMVKPQMGCEAHRCVCCSWGARCDWIIAGDTACDLCGEGQCSVTPLARTPHQIFYAQGAAIGEVVWQSSPWAILNVGQARAQVVAIDSPVETIACHNVVFVC